MATGAFGHTHVWLHIADIQESKEYRSTRTINMEEKCELKKDSNGSNPRNRMRAKYIYCLDTKSFPWLSP